jgi:hypothetical protein
MIRKFYSNSPLKKGDKGGCKDDMPEIGSLSRRKNQETTPPPPLIRGNLPQNSGYLPCPAGFMGKGQG